jgi:hypothetical protein
MCPKICCGKAFQAFSALPWLARQNYIPSIPATIDRGFSCQPESIVGALVSVASF